MIQYHLPSNQYSPYIHHHNIVNHNHLNWNSKQNLVATQTNEMQLQHEEFPLQDKVHQTLHYSNIGPARHNQMTTSKHKQTHNNIIYFVFKKLRTFHFCKFANDYLNHYYLSLLLPKNNKKLTLKMYTWSRI